MRKPANLTPQAQIVACAGFARWTLMTIRQIKSFAGVSSGHLKSFRLEKQSRPAKLKAKGGCPFLFCLHLRFDEIFRKLSLFFHFQIKFLVKSGNRSHHS